VLSLIENSSTSRTPVYIVNLNALDQITIAGSLVAIEVVLRLAQSKGAQKAQLLRVSVPSHCALLNSVSKKISNKMETFEFKPAKVPYIGNCRARSLRSGKEIKADLSLGIANPVKWHESTALIFELGARLFVEVGPGQVLANMAQKEFSDARVVPMYYSGFESKIILTKREMES